MTTAVGPDARDPGSAPVSAAAAPEPRAGAPAPSRVSRLVAVAVLAAALLTALVTRLVGLDGSLMGDEAQTVIEHVRHGPGHILTTFHLNNHVLFSLLAWASAEVLGDNEVAYRLPTTLAGLAALGVVAGWAWRRFGPAVGAALAVVIAVSPLHIDWTSLARGYGLASLAAAAVLVGAVEFDRTSANWARWCYAVGGLVGTLTLPIFAIPFVGHTLVLLRRRDLRRPVLVTIGTLGVVAVVLAAPLLVSFARGDRSFSIDTAVGAEEQTLAPHALLTGPGDALVVSIADEILLARPMTRLLRWSLLAAVYAPLAAAGVWAAARRGHGLAAHLVVPVGLFYLTFIVLRSYSHPRFTTFLGFHMTLVLVLGGAALARPLLSRDLAAVGAVAACGLAAVALVGAVDYDRDQVAPSGDFKQAARIIEGSGVDRVLTNYRVHALLYYVEPELFVDVPQAEVGDAICTMSGPFAFVEYGKGPPVDASCLADAGATRIELPYDGERWIDVWLVPAGAAAPRPAA